MKALYSLIFLLINTQFLYSQELFVSPNGNDNNSGTQNEPLKTLAKALSISSQGTIYLLEGTYKQVTVVSGKNGTDGNPIIISAYPGHQVIFDGTQVVETPWEHIGNNIYKTTPGFTLWQLFEDGLMLNAARWPNVDGFIEDEQPITATPLPNSLWDQPGTWGKSSASSTNGKMIDNGTQNLSALNIDLEDAIAILNVGSFKTTYAPVTSHSIGDDFFTYDSAISDKFVTWQKPDKAYYFLEGKLELLDHPGEWYYDTDGSLYIYTKDGQSPNDKVIEGKVQSYAIEMNDCSHIHIKGIQFRSTTIKGNDCQYLNIEDCHFKYPSYSKRMLREFGEYNNVTLFSGKNKTDSITICNNVFEYSEGEAFVIHGKNHLIENNLVRHIDFSCANLYNIGSTISFICDNSVFRNNTLYVAGASETLLPGSHNLIEYNEAWSTAHLQNDGAIIQLMVTPAIGTISRYNWLHDNVRNGYRMDGSLDTGNTGQTGSWDAWGKQTKRQIYGNVIWNCPNGLMIKGDYHQVVNNTVFNNSTSDIVMINPKPYGANHNSICRNNLGDLISGFRGGRNPDEYPLPPLSDHNWNGYYEDGIAQNLLMDVANRDFRPLPNSVLVDAGSSEINTDITIDHPYEGDTYDIGAYESGGTYWIPGHQTDKCTHPVPAHQSISNAAEAMLAWKPAYQSESFNVYFGTSATAIENATTSSDEFLGNFEKPNVHSVNTIANTDYYWRVDAITSSGISIGDVWQFTANVSTDVSITKTARIYLKAFPNPTKGSFIIHGITHPTSYAIYNMQGEICAKGMLSNINETLTIEQLNAGVYFFICDSDEFNPFKIIKN